MAVSAIPVEKEYEKLSNVKPEDIKEIMAWLQLQPHLPHQYISGKYCCFKFNAENDKKIGMILFW